jgi:hypothetical protein
MVTADPAVIEYADGRPHLTTAALPWDRTYVLLSTTRVMALARDNKPVGALPVEFTAALARDAVRSVARGCEDPLWWNGLRKCGELTGDIPWLPPNPAGAKAVGGERHLVYDRTDPVARDLAERIVALSAADPASSSGAAALASAIPGARGMSVHPVTPATLNANLKRGDDFAYIVALPRRPADKCVAARRLIDRVRWLAHLDDDMPMGIIPLVDARMHAIVNHEKIGLAVDWYGNVTIQAE